MDTFLMAGAVSAVIVALLTGDERLLYFAAFLGLLGGILAPLAS